MNEPAVVNLTINGRAAQARAPHFKLVVVSFMAFPHW